MDDLFKSARAAHLIKPGAAGSIDGTGFESRYVSRYFLRIQSGRCKQFRPWAKRIMVCDHATHLITAMVISTQPCHDAKYFPEALTQAAQRQRFDFLAADGAFDAEAFHALCRENLGIRQTAIPVNSRGHARAVVKGRYRREMQTHFPKSRFGQRWQSESVFSRMKRRLGPDLRARQDESRVREISLKVLTHNLMILRCCA